MPTSYNGNYRGYCVVLSQNFKDFDPNELHFSINDIRNNFAGMAKDIWDGGDDD